MKRYEGVIEGDKYTRAFSSKIVEIYDTDNTLKKIRYYYYSIPDTICKRLYTYDGDRIEFYNTLMDQEWRLDEEDELINGDIVV
jgi:hypothetical protein